MTWKNLLEGFNSKSELAQEKISTVDDSSIQGAERKKIKGKRTELRGLRNNIELINTCVMGEEEKWPKYFKNNRQTDRKENNSSSYPKSSTKLKKR